MSMLDIAVTRELIRAVHGLILPSREGLPCWCPAGWPRAGHSDPCARMQAAIYEARKAGY